MSKQIPFSFYQYLKAGVTPEDYEKTLELQIRALDEWFYKNQSYINGVEVKISNVGVLDAYATYEGKPYLDFRKTAVYFGRWENSNTFKGKAVLGIEYGMLYLIDALLDNWHKQVENREGELDSVVDGLFALRDDIISSMQRNTYLDTKGWSSYSLPAINRPKPHHLYFIEFYDISDGDNGAVFQFAGTDRERLSRQEKFKAARELALTLGSKNIIFHGVWLYDSPEEFQKTVFQRTLYRDGIKCKELNTARNKAAVFYKRDKAKRRSDMRKLEDVAAAVDKALGIGQAPLTATGHMIAEDARKQQELYSEMKRRVQSLETGAKAESNHWVCELKSEPLGEWQTVNVEQHPYRGCSEEELKEHVRKLANEASKAKAEIIFESPLDKLAVPDIDQVIAQLEKERTVERLKSEIAQWKLRTNASEAAMEPKIILENKVEPKQTIVVGRSSEKSGSAVYGYDLETGKFNEVGGPSNIDIVLSSPPELITMNLYQQYALLTANKNLPRNSQMVNALFGLNEESGEVTGLWKKRWFHPWSPLYYEKMSREEFDVKVIDECGDVLWYLAWIADLCGVTLGEVAKRNREKLVQRHGKGSSDAKK